MKTICFFLSLSAFFFTTNFLAKNANAAPSYYERLKEKYSEKCWKPLDMLINSIDEDNPILEKELYPFRNKIDHESDKVLSEVRFLKEPTSKFTREEIEEFNQDKLRLDDLSSKQINECMTKTKEMKEKWQQASATKSQKSTIEIGAQRKATTQKSNIEIGEHRKAAK